MPDRFRIDLVGFPGLSREDAARVLSAGLRLKLSSALSYIDRVPVTAHAGVDGNRAREYVKTLLGLGAEVRVVSETTGKCTEYNVTQLRARRGAKAAPQTTPTVQAVGTSAMAASNRPDPLEETASVAAYVCCPVCNQRQAAAQSCGRCGYTFPTVSWDHAEEPQAEGNKETERSVPEPDVFASLRLKPRPARPTSKRAGPRRRGLFGRQPRHN